MKDAPAVIGTFVSALALVVLALVVIWLLNGHPGFHVWEDGSWGVGNFPYILKGCFSWGICQ